MDLGIWLRDLLVSSRINCLSKTLEVAGIAFKKGFPLITDADNRRSANGVSKG